MQQSFTTRFTLFTTLKKWIEENVFKHSHTHRHLPCSYSLSEWIYCRRQQFNCRWALTAVWYNSTTLSRLFFKHQARDCKINTFICVKMYLSRCFDNILPAWVTLKGLCQFAEQINTHFNCIKLVFAFCCWGRGGDKQRWQGGSQAADH